MPSVTAPARPRRQLQLRHLHPRRPRPYQSHRDGCPRRPRAADADCHRSVAVGCVPDRLHRRRAAARRSVRRVPGPRPPRPPRSVPISRHPPWCSSPKPISPGSATPSAANPTPTPCGPGTSLAPRTPTPACSTSCRHTRRPAGASTKVPPPNVARHAAPPRGVGRYRRAATCRPANVAITAAGGTTAVIVRGEHGIARRHPHPVCRRPGFDAERRSLSRQRSSLRLLRKHDTVRRRDPCAPLSRPRLVRRSVHRVTEAAVDAGFILRPEADAMIAMAEQSTIGTGVG